VKWGRFRWLPESRKGGKFEGGLVDALRGGGIRLDDTKNQAENNRGKLREMGMSSPRKKNQRPPVGDKDSLSTRIIPYQGSSRVANKEPARWKGR